MAETDQEQKTEHPTGKRISEARQKGQLAISREVGTWALLVGALIVVMWLLPRMSGQLLGSLRFFLEQPHAIGLEGRGLQAALGAVMSRVAVATVITFGLLMFAAIVGTMVQTGFYFNTTRLEFSIMKLNPFKGLKQLFSMASLVELLKSFVKLVVVGGVVFFVFKPLVEIWPRLVGHNLIGSMVFLHKEVVYLIVMIMLVVTFVAIGDLFFQRFQYFKNLRMTKQEVKDEHKQMEGDPMIKSRLRSIRIDKARKRMMAQVPRADVVVTNPTHYAVALEYDSSRMAAPVVLAKGMNRIAERIREVANEHEIPLVSNPPLARALYDTVEVDEAIKPEQYRAVAEVISYVYKLRNRKL